MALKVSATRAADDYENWNRDNRSERDRNRHYSERDRIGQTIGKR
jgi:hypothetical protein